MSLDNFALAALADRLLEIAADDPFRLAALLDNEDAVVRGEILGSDFLNALQVFVYFFREEPTSIGAERLTLHAAGDAARGVVFEENDLYELVFRIEEGAPVIEVRAGEETEARFTGESAYRDALRSIAAMS
jgi:hypothetical protein